MSEEWLRQTEKSMCPPLDYVIALIIWEGIKNAANI